MKIFPGSEAECFAQPRQALIFGQWWGGAAARSAHSWIRHCCDPLCLLVGSSFVREHVRWFVNMRYRPNILKTVGCQRRSIGGISAFIPPNKKNQPK